MSGVGHSQSEEGFQNPGPTDDEPSEQQVDDRGVEAGPETGVDQALHPGIAEKGIDHAGHATEGRAVHQELGNIGGKAAGHENSGQQEAALPALNQAAEFPGPEQIEPQMKNPEMQETWGDQSPGFAGINFRQYRVIVLGNQELADHRLPIPFHEQEDDDASHHQSHGDRPSGKWRVQWPTVSMRSPEPKVTWTP